MNAEKKKKLEAAGWKATTVQDFLNLSAADMEFIETKLALGRRLRDLRARKRLTQAALAATLKTSQSRLARMEKGDPSVSMDLLIMALYRMGETRRELARAI